MNSPLRATLPMLTAIASLAVVPCRAQITQAERDAMVQAHNVVRAEAAPYPVPPLPAVSYSAALETGDPKAAQTWAAGCLFQHSGRSGVGENLYALCSSATPPRPPPELAVANWDGEGAYYAYTANACSPPPFPGTCGHYTQVVWRSSTAIGCGIAQCSTNSPCGAGFPNWFFWVCQYSPAGNFLISISPPVTDRPYYCDYDGNGTFESQCTALPFALYIDSFEVGVERWSVKSPP